ncbi:hypothetical protein RRG08_004027 [Elysia crispata]|uniref:Uncharacterized protein n=1 Tax=Elysia crispata TaxID=231223 RepID=A0AAE0XE91_9GAST|nr:hypothetical protein RRG08_004027 [Elysia crispata]
MELSELVGEEETRGELSMLRKVCTTMSDRAAVTEKFDEMRREIVVDEVQTNFIYCNAHYLRGLSGESAFGDLNFDMGHRRQCSLFNRAAKHMLKRNRTMDWLSNKSGAEQERILAEERKVRRKLRKKYMKQEDIVRLKISEKLAENEWKKQKKKELKGAKDKQEIIDKIMKEGGCGRFLILLRLPGPTDGCSRPEMDYIIILLDYPLDICTAQDIPTFDSYSPTTAGKSPNAVIPSPLAHLKSKKENLSPGCAKTPPKSQRLSKRQSLNSGQLTPRQSLGVAAVRDHKRMESSTPYRLRQRQVEAQHGKFEPTLVAWMAAKHVKKIKNNKDR